MSSQIIRIHKHKSFQKIGSSCYHNSREDGKEAYYKNADPHRKHLNQQLKGDGTSQEIRDLVALDTNRRKNAVMAIEFVVTASPEAVVFTDEKQKREFFEKSLEWLEDRYGADRIASAVVHEDESTPHMHVAFVPLVETEKGMKLNASKFFGDPEQMRQMWSDFHKEVTQEFGLTRDTFGGEKPTKSSHTTLRDFYAKLPEMEKEHEALSAKVEKTRERYEGTLEKYKKLMAAGKEKFEAYTKLEKRVQNYEKRLETQEEEFKRLSDSIERIKKDKASIDSKIAEKTIVVDSGGLFRTDEAEYVTVEDVKQLMYEQKREIEDKHDEQFESALESATESVVRSKNGEIQTLKERLSEKDRQVEELKKTNSRLQDRLNRNEMQNEQTSRVSLRQSSMSRLNRSDDDLMSMS